MPSKSVSATNRLCVTLTQPLHHHYMLSMQKWGKDAQVCVQLLNTPVFYACVVYVVVEALCFLLVHPLSQCLSCAISTSCYCRRAGIVCGRPCRFGHSYEMSISLSFKLLLLLQM